MESLSNIISYKYLSMQEKCVKDKLGIASLPYLPKPGIDNLVPGIAINRLFTLLK